MFRLAEPAQEKASGRFSASEVIRVERPVSSSAGVANERRTRRARKGLTA